jgi:hypothetical protein
MAENDLPTVSGKLSRNKWAYIGCGFVILMSIAFVLIVFWLGTESANPWGQSPGPGP